MEMLYVIKKGAIKAEIIALSPMFQLIRNYFIICRAVMIHL